MMRKFGWILILIIITGFNACQRAKDKVSKVIDRSVDKAKETAKDAWVSAIDFTFDALITTEKTSFQKVFGVADSLHVKEIEGVWIDMPVAFYYCFLKYRADKKVILDYISSQETQLFDISYSTWYEADTAKLYKNLKFIENEHPEIADKLVFFTELKNLNNLEFFECNRYPHAHYIAYDLDSGIIYHHFEKYWD